MLDILYEDKHIIVVVKPVDILSQSDGSHKDDILSLVKKYLETTYQKANAYVGLIHRLDFHTSGIMVFAKRTKAASRLSEKFKTHQVIKKYLAIVKGITKNKETLTNYLIKDEKLVKSYVVNNASPNAKRAILDYVTLKTGQNRSLISVTLHSGRHHQIRVQMANIHHPLVGDKLYGDNSEGGFKLHSYYLAFHHPMTQELLEFVNYPSWYKMFDEN